MDDMIGGVPPSINVGNHMNSRLHLSKMSSSYTNSALLENDHHLYEGMMLSNGAICSAANASSLSNSKAELSNASKRTLSSLYWNEDDVAGTSSSNKRFDLDGSVGGGDHHGSGIVRTDQENGTATSIASLLNQLPQTPSLHQQTMLGSIPYQITGMNWYG